jgi:hypothetical protein
MKYLFGVLALCLGLFFSPAFAADAPQTAGQVKLELLKQLEKDGYLSQKLADEAKLKYVDPKEVSVPLAKPGNADAAKAEPSFYERYVTLANFFKLVAVVLLLVWASGFIAMFAKGLIFVIIAVPKEVYQTVFLALTLTMTLRPELLWASQAYYLVLFGAFANVMLAFWVIESHPKLEAALKQLFKLGIPPMSVASFWGMLYFGALAIAYQSQVFGFFAAVCLSGILSFGMYYSPGILTLFFNEKATGAVIWGHLVVLAGYSIAKVMGVLPAQVGLFAIGLQYYCTIALGVGFLVGASPFSKNPGGFLAMFIAVFVAAMAGYYIYDLKVIGSIICVFAVLLFLEWVGYLSYKTGFLVGTFVMGIVLFVASLLMENFASFLVLRLA